MNYSKHPRFALIIASLLFSFVTYSQSDTSRITIVLSLDGFRWDYPLKAVTPNLDSIAKCGVKAVSLIPSFPSKTFPNHYTIATGLVPDHHGLINNTFLDEKSNQIFAIGNSQTRNNPVYYGGEPIWVTAHKQGIKTASFFWVGSELPIQGIQPDYWKRYDESIFFAERIDTIYKWLQLPVGQRPKLIMAYYHEPDAVGHHLGPNDISTLQTVHELDSMVGILCNKINSLPIANNINLIILSDHGMGEIIPANHVVLRDFIPASWPVKMIGGNPNYNFYAEPNWIDSCYNKLKGVEHISVWRPDQVPLYLHYGTNPRMGGLIVVADSSCSVSVTNNKNNNSRGTHGYDFRNTDMHAIFYAVGPSFRKGFIHPSFSNTNIYSLLAHLLGIKAEKTDGDLQNVIEMLQ